MTGGTGVPCGSREQGITDSSVSQDGEAVYHMNIFNDLEGYFALKIAV